MRNVDSENFLKRVREDYGGIKLDELSVRECFINPMFCRVEICGVKKWVFTEKSGVGRERRVKKKRKERASNNVRSDQIILSLSLSLFLTVQRAKAL